jgi:hypothetical protein
MFVLYKPHGLWCFMIATWMSTQKQWAIWESGPTVYVTNTSWTFLWIISKYSISIIKCSHPCSLVIGRIMDQQECIYYSPETCGYVRIHGKGELRYQMNQAWWYSCCSPGCLGGSGGRIAWAQKVEASLSNIKVQTNKWKKNRWSLSLLISLP